jgi:hypothetical protein
MKFFKKINEILHNLLNGRGFSYISIISLLEGIKANSQSESMGIISKKDFKLIFQFPSIF